MNTLRNGNLLNYTGGDGHMTCMLTGEIGMNITSLSVRIVKSAN